MDGYTHMKRGALFLTLTAVMVLALLAGATAALAQSERILNFKSFVKVHPDASMTVTEDITVQATGQEIKRGIIRDFPTTYRDRLGNTVTVGFKVEEVLRDGRAEPYHTQSVVQRGQDLHRPKRRISPGRGLHLHHPVPGRPGAGVLQGL